MPTMSMRLSFLKPIIHKTIDSESYLLYVVLRQQLYLMETNKRDIRFYINTFFWNKIMVVSPNFVKYLNLL